MEDLKKIPKTLDLPLYRVTLGRSAIVSGVFTIDISLYGYRDPANAIVGIFWTCVIEIQLICICDLDFMETGHRGRNQYFLCLLAT